MALRERFTRRDAGLAVATNMRWKSLLHTINNVILALGKMIDAFFRLTLYT